MKENADTLGKRTPNESSAPYAIPAADVNGKLSSGWGGSVNTLATLNSSAKVVENPANATATPTAGKIPIADANGKFSIASAWFYYFKSSELTITGNGVDISSAHGLGASPSLARATIICKTAEGGYAIGDEAMPFGRHVSGTETRSAHGVYSNATTIGFVTGGDGTWIENRTGGSIGTMFTITNANWKLVLRAWA